MRMCLYEDRGAANLAPLAVARPAFDLFGGLGTLKDGLVRYFQPDSLGYLVRKSLAPALQRREPAAPVNDPRWLRAGPALLANARWLPGTAPSQPLNRKPHLAMCGPEIAYAMLGVDQLAGVSPSSLDDCLDDWIDLLPKVEVGGCVAKSADDLLAHAGARIAAEYPQSDALHSPPPGVALIGPSELLHLDQSAAVEPMVLLDTSRGPIVLEAGVRVRAFSRIEGPCVVGAGSDIRGVLRSRTVIGPKCRVAGTLENCILLGFSDIAPGCVFSGAYLGEGVRMGPGVLCESAPGGAIVIGDFARLAAGVLLDRGTNLGAFARVQATGRIAPYSVPAFGIVSREGIEPDERVNRHIQEVADEMATLGRMLEAPELELYRELSTGGADANHRTLPLPFRRAG